MLRALIVLVALTGVARADLASEAKSTTDAVLGRYDDKVGHRNPLLKLYDLIDSSNLDNVKHAREHLLEAKDTFDKAWKAHEEVDAQFKLKDLQKEVQALDEEIDDYVKKSRTTLWGMMGGVVVLGIALFGGTLLAIVRRRRRR